MEIFFTFVNAAGGLGVCSLMERQIQENDGVTHIESGQGYFVKKIDGDEIHCVALGDLQPGMTKERTFHAHELRVFAASRNAETESP